LCYGLCGSEGCSANPLSIKVKVNELPRASFSYVLKNDTFYFTPTDTSLTSYQWSFGDSSFLTQKMPIHWFTKSGKYLVNLKTYNSFGCFTDSTVEIVYATVGAKELELSKRTLLYPNPVSDIVNLKYNSQNTNPATVNIYNLVGALVKSETVSNNNYQLNVSDISNGVYIIEIRGNDWSESQKLMIQR